MKPWFNPHGMKMRVNPERSDRSMVVIESGHSIASLSVMRDKKNPGSVSIGWVIKHQPGCTATGSLRMTLEQANLAFGLPSDSTQNNEEYAEGYGSEAGIPGLFIRDGAWLNIPCPGTACDGDPNISVFLSDENRTALRKLLGPPPKPA